MSITQRSPTLNDKEVGSAVSVYLRVGECKRGEGSLVNTYGKAASAAGSAVACGSHNISPDLRGKGGSRLCGSVYSSTQRAAPYRVFSARATRSPASRANTRRTLALLLHALDSTASLQRTNIHEALHCRQESMIVNTN